MVYKWIAGSPFGKADPEKVARELQSMGRNPSRRDIVEKAEDPRSELHNCFEWDNLLAAMKYRLSQADRILYSLVAVEEDGNRKKVLYPFVYREPEDDEEETQVSMKVQMPVRHETKSPPIKRIAGYLETILREIDAIDGYGVTKALVKRALLELRKEAGEQRGEKEKEISLV